MRIFLVVVCFLVGVVGFSQKRPNKSVDAESTEMPLKKEKSLRQGKATTDGKATIDQYKIITLQRDTTYVDTSLTIQSDYTYNYLRKDNFGLLAFANEGQTYTTLDFGLQSFSPFPETGFSAKHFNFSQANDIRYHHVATPLTELYFKTVMEQGQSLDAFITMNTSERFNFSIAYKGLRSLGKYKNQLSSTGNFRFTASYITKNSRYYFNSHFTAQDILNQENGGIIFPENFESDDEDFSDRQRLEVFTPDAESVLKGNRYFVDHAFRINNSDAQNNLYVQHQFNYEHKFFEYYQPTLSHAVNGVIYKRYGESYVTSNLNNKTRYNKMYNKLGAVYENKTLGEFQFFIEDIHYNQYYNRVLFSNDQMIPNAINDRINTLGGQYVYQKEGWKGTFLYSKSISDQEISNLDAQVRYRLNNKNNFSFQFQNLNRIPNLTYTLYQSDFVNYNWYNQFKNEKINNIEAAANTQWLTATVQFSTINDCLYFSNDGSTAEQFLVTPKQYDATINYFSVKASKEFKLWKFALDNTVLYQKVDQNEAILNVPQIVTRNTFYYTDYLFDKALFLQTGFTLNYFSKYYANEYNPVIGDFFVQNQKEIGDFPMLDFFINARIRQTRIFLKAEHFNSAMTRNTFYSAPSYPYRDFIIRFGLVWNFFQ
jgi:hypothetical protein